jgi:pyruvate/2-oxoglutarate dehydrogenase complex dihydrolipoamide dehydrogenase (E3) component
VTIHIREGSDRILGATVVARHAGEIINHISLAIISGMRLDALALVGHPYPTQAAAIRIAAEMCARRRRPPLLKRWLSWRRH